MTDGILPATHPVFTQDAPESVGGIGAKLVVLVPSCRGYHQF